MNTLALQKPESTKKLIELPNKICRRLAVHAAARGMSVKKLIESMVITSVQDADDEAVYAYLMQTRPEGREMLSNSEQTELLSQLRQKATME